MSFTQSNTRARILAAAEGLLSRRSSQFLTLADVGEVASVSAPLIVRYFNSKNDLFIEAGFRLVQRDIEAILMKIETQNPKFGVFEYIDVCYAYVWNNARMTRDLMSASWWWHSEDESKLASVTTPHVRAMAKGLHNDSPAFSVLSEDVRSAVVHALAVVLSNHQRASLACSVPLEQAREAARRLARVLLTQMHLLPAQDALV